MSGSSRLPGAAAAAAECAVLTQRAGDAAVTKLLCLIGVGMRLTGAFPPLEKLLLSTLGRSSSSQLFDPFLSWSTSAFNFDSLLLGETSMTRGKILAAL